MFHFHDYGRKGSDFHCMKLFHHDSTHGFRNSTSSRGGSVSLAFYGQHPRSATDWHDTRGPRSNCTTRSFPVRPGFSSTQSLSGMLQISPENLTDCSLKHPFFIVQISNSNFGLEKNQQLEEVFEYLRPSNCCFFSQILSHFNLFCSRLLVKFPAMELHQQLWCMNMEIQEQNSMAGITLLLGPSHSENCSRRCRRKVHGSNLT